MAGPAFVFTISMPGLKPLSVALSRLRTDISDWTPFWTDRFAPFFYRHVLQDFVLEGGASGQSWAPLSPRYAAWKQRHGYVGGILERTGRMKASLTNQDDADAVFEPTPTSLTIGTRVPYAVYHQFGTRSMPQRPPMRLDPAFMAVVGRDLQTFVQEAWQKRRAESS